MIAWILSWDWEAIKEILFLISVCFGGLICLLIFAALNSAWLHKIDPDYDWYGTDDDDFFF